MPCDLPKKTRKLSTKKPETTGECPICCLEIKKTNRVPVLKCNHIFHKKCLTQWLKKGGSCPLCREDIHS